MSTPLIRVSDVLTLLYPGTLDFVSQDALDRGSRLHEHMEISMNHLLMELDDPSMEHYLPDERHRLEEMLGWFTTSGIYPDTVEQCYESPLGFRGHPDMVGMRKGGKGVTIDWKFAEALTEMNEMQAEAYRQLTGYPTWLVQCNKEGKITVKKCPSNPSLWAAFVSGLQVKHFQNHRAIH